MVSGHHEQSNAIFKIENSYQNWLKLVSSELQGRF